MNSKMRYTEEEVAVIDGVIGSLYGRMADKPLRQAYWNVHEHLQSGRVEASDLRRIRSVLEFSDPGQCTSCHKEGYREFTTVLLKTRAMLRAVC